MRDLTFGVLLIALMAGSVHAHGSTYREVYRPPPPPRVFPAGLTPPTAKGEISWENWWGLNKDDILHPGSAVTARPPRLPDPDQSTLRELVLPALLEVLDQLPANLPPPGPPDTYDSSARARVILSIGSLAGSVDPPPDRVADRLIEHLNSPETRVRVCAAFALALLRKKDAKIVGALLDRLPRRHVDRTTKGACMLAIGLLRLSPRDPGYERFLRHLRTTIAESEDTEEVTCALLAMGLSRSPRFLADLEKILGTAPPPGEAPVDARVLAAAVSAVGKICEVIPGASTPETVGYLEQVLRRNYGTSERSVAIALGQLGGRPDAPPRVRVELIGLLFRLSNSGHSTTRQLALLSLGRFGAATRLTEHRSMVRERLTQSTRNGEDGPFALLALGMLGRSPFATPQERDAIRRLAEERLATIRRDKRYLDSMAVKLISLRDRRMAKHVQQDFDPMPCVLALGLVRARASVPLLRGMMLDPDSDGRLRGYCALALGMIGDPCVGPLLRNEFLKVGDGDFVILGSMAAGLDGRREVAPSLIPFLTRDGTSRSYRQIALRALGKLGDRRALEPLVAVLRDRKKDASTRSVAAVALADLFDRHSPLILTRTTKDLNYPARPEAIRLLLRAF